MIAQRQILGPGFERTFLLKKLLKAQYGPFIMDHIGERVATSTKAEKSIGVTAFKSQCLGLIDDVAKGKTGRVVLLKHNRSIAAIVPFADHAEECADLWGAMRGTVTVAPGVDLTDATGETGRGSLKWLARFYSTPAPQSG